MSQTILEPEVQNPGTKSGRWMVVIFNNDHTSMDDVVSVLMQATGCDEQEAYIEMWEAHTFGKAPVHFAGKAATFNLLYAFPLLLLADGEGPVARVAEAIAWAFVWWGVALYWLAGLLYAGQLRRLLEARREVAA